MAKGNCQFKGTGGQYFVTAIIHLLILGTITFGLYMPWALVRLFRLKASHTTIKGRPVSFTGTGGQLFLLGLIQGLITLITFGIYGPWALCKIFSWRARNTLVDGTPSQFVGTGGSLFFLYLIHLMILPMLTLGLYSFYGWFRFYAWKEERMRYGGEKTSFGAGFGGFLKVTIISTILTALTFYLFLPWAMAMFFRWQINGLAVGPEEEVEHFPPVKTSIVAVAILFVIPLAIIATIAFPLYEQYKSTIKQFEQMARTQGRTPRMQRTYKVPKQTSPVAKRPARKPVSRRAQIRPSPSQPAPAPSAVKKPAPAAAPVAGVDYELEIRKLNNLINLGSKDPAAFYNRAWLNAYKGDAQMAEKDYTQALTLNTKYEDAYYNRGLAYVKMKKYREAVADFSQAIKLNPRAEDAYCNRGNAKFQMGKIDLALRDLTAALRINPNDGDVYYNRAVVYLAKGLKPKAMSDFRKAASLGNNEAKRYLGKAPTQPKTSRAAAVTSHVGWTMNLSNVATPVTPASGRIHGKAFTVEAAKMENNILTLRQGKDFFPDRAVSIFMFLKKEEALEGKTFNIATDHGFGAPHIHMKWRDGGKKAPETKIFMKDYALRLQFKKRENGTLPGNIFLSLPDDSKSFVAGTFLAQLQ
jgi:tetratricopeptide (TPR) repeat protein